MRICLISREYPPDTGWGGIGTFTYHLAHGLQELGHEVEVVCLAADQAKTVDDEGVLVHRVLPSEMLGKLGGMAVCMPYSRFVVTTSSGLWQKFLERHEQKPFDVVDAPELLAEGILPATTRIVPLVIRLYTPHFKFMAEQLHDVKATFDHQLVSMLERMALLQADAITSPSEDLADFVASDLNCSRESIRIIRNPIDPVAFAPQGPNALETTNGMRVLFIGRLEERKGITYLVRAIPGILEACPDTEFVIIGADTQFSEGGQRSVLQDLRDYLTRNQVIDKVKFITRVPFSQLASYYRSADICVVPSVYDNSPYTCLEAMSCGRPVVGTAAGGTKEYVQHSQSGLIVPVRDAEALKSAIVTLLKDSGLRASMGQSARQRVVDNFQRRRIAADTLALYDDARQNFAAKQNSLYRKEPQQALPDAAAFLGSFEEMMYDSLYRQSWRFRLGHWWRLCISQPGLIPTRLLTRLRRRGNAHALARKDAAPGATAPPNRLINDEPRTEAVAGSARSSPDR